MKLALSKVPNGLIPADPQSQELTDGLKVGEVIHSDFRKMRNPAFHRKFFALLNMAFDMWEPGEVDSKYGVPEKNFDRFREDVTILAGFFSVVVRLDGTTRIEAKSISFAKMDDMEFAQLYNAVINVLLKRIPAMGSMTAEQVDDAVNSILAFG